MDSFTFQPLYHREGTSVTHWIRDSVGPRPDRDAMGIKPHKVGEEVQFHITILVLNESDYLHAPSALPPGNKHPLLLSSGAGS
jgi:hypothetical protein